MRHFNFYIFSGIFFLTVAIYTAFFQTSTKDPELVSYQGREEKYDGVVVSDPIQKQNSKQFVFKYKNSKILISTDLYQKINYGDKVTLVGEIIQPENFLTENGRTFDYKNYLAKEKIFFVMRYPKVVSQSSGDNSFYKIIYKIKNNFILGIKKTIPFPESALASGIVVAGKVALPGDILDQFVKTGTSQVVVLSGYNITLVASALASGLVFLPRTLALILAGAGISIFSIMAGAGASVVRACIMALIAICAKILRRDYDASRALIISAMVMLVWNPMLLLYDPSFELSFIATFGLIVFSPIVKKYLIKIPEKFNLREITAQTIATQIFVTPFLLYLTGTLSLVSLPANIILIFLTPISMFLSFCTGLIAIFSIWFAIPIGFLATASLTLMLKAVQIFSALPYSSTTLPAFPFWLCVICYLILARFILKHLRKTSQ